MLCHVPRVLKQPFGPFSSASILFARVWRCSSILTFLCNFPGELNHVLVRVDSCLLSIRLLNLFRNDARRGLWMQEVSFKVENPKSRIYLRLDPSPLSVAAHATLANCFSRQSLARFYHPIRSHLEVFLVSKTKYFDSVISV